MAVFNPPLEEGLYFQSAPDPTGRVNHGWFGSIQTDIGYALMLQFSYNGLDFFLAPDVNGNPNGGFIRVWETQDAMRGEVGKTVVNPDGTETVTGHGGMGKFLLGHPGFPGVVKVNVQPILDKWFDPTPLLPAHTNADDSSMVGFNEVIKMFLAAPPVPDSANQIVFKPAA